MSASPPPPEPDTASWRLRAFASLENAKDRRFFAGQPISMAGT